MSEATICVPYDAAVDAVKRGWSVIPVHALTDRSPGGCTCGRAKCPHPGKHPAEGAWQKSRYISTADCWTLFKEDPRGLNAGILTGSISNIVIVDVDPRNGGEEEFLALLETYGGMPDTYTVRTGSGGWHFYFLLPEGMTLPSCKLGDGIDFLSDGRMAIAPGSKSAAGPYAVHANVALAVVPEWIAKLATTKGTKESGPITMAADLPTRDELTADQQHRFYRYAISVIERESDGYATAPWGQGNGRLFNACCNIIEILQSPWSGVEETYATARLEAARIKRMEAARAAGRPESGQTADELAITWASAQRRVRGKGRPLPEGEDPRWDGLLFEAPFATGSAMVSGIAGSPVVTGSPFLQPSQAEAAAIDSLEGEGVQITEADRVQFAQAEAQAQWEAAVRQKAADFRLADAAKEYNKTGAFAGGSAVTEDDLAALDALMLDADDLDELPNPEPLIVDVLDMDSESWIIGAPGGFKSFVALDWAGHVGQGLDWQGCRTTQGSVLYVVAEGAKGIKLRKKAWCETYGPMKNVKFLPEPVQVTDVKAWAVLVEWCRRNRPALIVLDTQARITVHLNENTSEMAVAIDAIRQMRAATGACVLVVHHTGRNGQDARGWSGLDGAQDTEIKVVRPEGPERKLLGAEIHFEKNKDAGEDGVFPIKMNVHDWGRDPKTGRALSSLSIKPMPPFSQPEERKRPLEVEERTNEVQALILEVLRIYSDPDDGATPSEVRKWVKEYCDQKDIPQVNPGTVDGNLPRLKLKNLVVKEGTKYRLP